ncbi:MAG: AAA family ATPase [Nitrosopumilaceae archaeon]|jgi:predicted kinase|uniref:AAA family ATPase n=2 Tax=Candidatus Nitrosomaritimum aestuariumsis TaxID=3342354 RepID=A0AC60W6V0_9ARCH|nr:AAA family ATPase [Nitrosopumilaceae archaeon]MBA4459541.1 AAA family ATPase [Nitrosopumilaceae archaeon]MBA4463227.1 AAA family ATPase [Nitrosopumilaceae archaeon]
MDVIMMIGIALSGKTTYRETNFDHEVIQLSYFNNNRKRELEYIEECLKEGKSIVIDDTNLTREIRKTHIDLARKYNAQVTGIFMNTSTGLIEQRRLRRRNPFPVAVINKQLRDLETPTKEEGFDKLIVHKDYVQPRDT